MIAFASATAHADVYAFTDERGVLHLTDSPVDTRYRLVLAEPKAVAPAATQAAAPVAAPVTAASNVNPELLALIRSAAAAHSVDPALVRAVIAAESNYNPRAVSRKGARGLMQLMPATAQRFGVTDVFDPAQNVQAGVRYLAELLQRFNQDLRLALAAYNAGEAAVIQHGNRVPPYRETRDYVPKVLEAYGRFRGA